MAFAFTKQKARLLLPVITGLANGETIQLFIDGKWEDKSNPSFDSAPENYRIKPKTININGFEIPAPLREPPKAGTSIYIPLVTSTSGGSPYMMTAWSGTAAHLEYLRLGLVHSTPEAATAHVKALRSFTETPET